ncbi:MAG: hypothetical protein MZV70_08495 [Desulfobacterales bacterium]|nr:hypothetical protein [Desulfobacterales bacterium]
MASRTNPSSAAQAGSPAATVPAARVTRRVFVSLAPPAGGAGRCGCVWQAGDTNEKYLDRSG